VTVEMNMLTKYWSDQRCG